MRSLALLALLALARCGEKAEAVVPAPLAAAPLPAEVSASGPAAPPLPPFAPLPPLAAPLEAVESEESPAEPSRSPTGLNVRSDTPKRGKLKSTVAVLATTSMACGGWRVIASAAACSWASCVADGAAGLPCETQTVYGSPCVSSTRRWLRVARAPKLAGSRTVKWTGDGAAATRSSW